MKGTHKIVKTDSPNTTHYLSEIVHTPTKVKNYSNHSSPNKIAYSNKATPLTPTFNNNNDEVIEYKRDDEREYKHNETPLNILQKQYDSNLSQLQSKVNSLEKQNQELTSTINEMKLENSRLASEIHQFVNEQHLFTDKNSNLVTNVNKITE